MLILEEQTIKLKYYFCRHHRKINLKYINHIFIALLFSSCVPPEKKTENEVIINTKSEQVQNLIGLEIEQKFDSLKFYCGEGNATERFLSTKAFVSYLEPKAKDVLLERLEDENINVRGIAVKAIGQTGDQSLAEKIIGQFKPRDTISVNNIMNASILECMGKLGSINHLKSLAAVSTYRPTDTLLLEAQCKALYQYTLRNLNVSEGTDLMVQYIVDERIPNKARLYAAHYLARSKELDIEKVKFQIANQFLKEKNVNVKMALALALKHTSDPEIQEIINQNLKDSEQDYRVIINLIRALQSYDYLLSTEQVFELIKHPNSKVAETAIQFLANHGNKEDAGIYREFAQQQDSNLLKPKLYKSFFKSLPYYYTKTRNAGRYDVLNLIKKENNDRMIASYLDALGEDMNSYEVIYNTAKESESAIILTAASRALGNILTNERFNANFNSSPRYARKKITSYMQELVETGDVGVITEVSIALAKEALNVKPVIDSLGFLLRAKNKLKLPSELETMQELVKAINALSDTINLNPPKSEKYISINKQMLETIGDSTRAIVKTTKGVFEIQFELMDAPATVVNFLSLAQQDFYDDKVFHRVVPNFVIQTGCTRGDGYGSIDHTIRSELNGYFDGEGYVGMASAGPHTESAQWFVTHSPTPHLDGRYTMFGKVKSGMDVVHAIEEGDKILDIIITNLK